MLQATADAAMWVAALPSRRCCGTTTIRWDQLDRRRVVVAFAAVAQVCIGYLLQLYRRRYRYASFDELLRVAAAVFVVGFLLTAVVFLPPQPAVPRSVPLLATGAALTGMSGVRAWRRQHVLHQRAPLGSEPIIVVGAGDAAAKMVETLFTFVNSPYRPIALLDDSPFKAGLHISGIKVEGTIDDLPEVARRHQATSVLLAIPTGDADLVRRVNHLADEIGIRLLVLPNVTDMFGITSITDIRPVAEHDLLGRAAADIDPDAVAGLHHRAPGDGHRRRRQHRQRAVPADRPVRPGTIDHVGPRRERPPCSAIEHRGAGASGFAEPRPRRHPRLRAAGRGVPRVATRGGVPRGCAEAPSAARGVPDEAWKTNVFGTEHVLEACARWDVERVVNISTDKAADPNSVLGLSKRLTERLTALRAATEDGVYVSVRFGNVLGSRGSVLHTFRAQAECGGPITVTHPDVTRYFMTVEEAVRLTIYAGAIGRSGEVLVLDMGEPIRILSVAERFAQQCHPPLEIVFTGLRQGEKLHEDLIATGEVDDRPIHPLITHVPVPPISLHEVEERAEGDRDTAALRRAAFSGLSVDVGGQAQSNDRSRMAADRR